MLKSGVIHFTSDVKVLLRAGSCYSTGCTKSAGYIVNQETPYSRYYCYLRHGENKRYISHKMLFEIVLDITKKTSETIVIHVCNLSILIDGLNNFHQLQSVGANVHFHKESSNTYSTDRNRSKVEKNQHAIFVRHALLGAYFI